MFQFRTKDVDKPLLIFTVRQKVFFLCLKRHTSDKIYFSTYQTFGATKVCSIFGTNASIISVKHNNRVCELLLDVLYIAFRYGVEGLITFLRNSLKKRATINDMIHFASYFWWLHFISFCHSPYVICKLRLVCLPGKSVLIKKRRWLTAKLMLKNVLQHSLSCFGPLLSNAEIAVGDQFEVVHHLL